VVRLEKFLARQPIFTTNRIVYGYELLFRSGPENSYTSTQPDFAAASSTDSLLLFGIERFTDGRRAFINCTREFLIRDYPTLLPRDRIVVEILETVRIDDQVIAACRRLKEAGYFIALDDFVDSPEWRALVPFADFLKVDLLITPPAEQKRLVDSYSRTGIALLAERVETYQDFHRTLDWGYTYFQGYFFARPQMLTRHDIPAYKLQYLRVLQAANQPQMNIHSIAERIKEESSLSYRLLRYLNSPAFPILTEVRSIPHALSLLGEQGIRRWVSLVAIACMGEGKPVELVMLPLIRARFLELLAVPARMESSASDLFLLGLLSVIDAILDMKMSDVLREIPIHEDIRGALLGSHNGFRAMLEIVLLYEWGDWEGVHAAAARLGLADAAIPDKFVQSVEWARGVLNGQPAADLAPSH
jgi:c-di-GMP-related signal transduction protein